MAGIFGYSKEAIRVKVKKCEGVLQPEFRKFSVDPQITSFEVLQSILAKAFDIKDEFTICYKTIDDWGQEIHVSILSDWDLDAAFLRAHNISLTNGSEPSLCLRVDLKQFSESSEEWDVTNSIPMTRVPLPEIKASPRLPGLIMNQVEKTFNMVQRALNFGEDGNIVLHPPRQPLSDSEFRRFLDPVGQIVHVKELRSVIYYGGIDPSLRKVVWKHILNVYPEGMSGKERMNYMKRKASEYYSLRDFWKELLQKGPVTGDLAYTTSMVRKDVLRTDRHHTFYAGSDDNLNIASLFNILTTYALHHPKVSYCQGMSDLASPLLVTMNDEAHAYICFCALMSRLGHNFMLDGIAMTQKFTHLAEALQFYDPEFYNYLKSHQADDLLFCYRWLLLEMKREFAFDDSLRMLEVLWSSLPAVPPVKELPLYETKFKPPAIVTPPVSPLVKTPRENAYTKVCALRRQNSAMSIASWAGATNQNVRANVTRQNHSLDETLSNSFNCEKVKACQSLDDAIISTDMPEVFKPVSPVEIKPVLINNANQKQEALSAISSGVNNLITKSGFQKSNFKDLKDRFVSSKKGLFQSLDKTDNANMIREEQETDKKPGRIVRNFNEFLNFASINRNLANKYIKNNDPDKPVITLTSSSFDEPKSNDVSLKSSSCDSSPEEYFPMTTSITRELKLELESLDRQVFGTNHHPQVTETPTENLNLECIETPTETSESIDSDETVPMCLQLTKDSKCRKQEDIFVWENPLHQQSPAEIQSAKYSAAQGEEMEYDGESGEIFEESQNGVKSVTPIRVVKKIQTSKKIKPSISTDTIETSMSQVQIQNKETNICMDHLNGVCPQMTNSCEEATENANNARTCNMDLPPPHEFGGGNPFLMFLCITVLLQHRDYVMQNSMDYNEMAMHFDKMVRKHNVIRVLNQARQMFAAYMKACSSGAQQNSNSVSSNGHVNT